MQRNLTYPTHWGGTIRFETWIDAYPIQFTPTTSSPQSNSQPASHNFHRSKFYLSFFYFSQWPKSSPRSFLNRRPFLTLNQPKTFLFLHSALPPALMLTYQLTNLFPFSSLFKPRFLFLLSSGRNERKTPLSWSISFLLSTITKTHTHLWIKNFKFFSGSSFFISINSFSLVY